MRISDWSSDVCSSDLLISHATSNRDVRDDDGQAADRFAAEFPGTIRVPDFAGPCEAKSYISSLAYLVVGRMHACIAAFRSEERRVGKEFVGACRVCGSRSVYK